MKLIKSISGLHNKKQWSFIIMLFTIAFIIIPFLNLYIKSSSSFYVSSLIINTLGKFMCYALLALALDLVWGYCGILSLGNAVFFAFFKRY